MIVNPAGNWFHGDTLGIHLNLTLIAPMISGAMLLACALLWVQSLRRGRRGPYPLQPVNLRRLGPLAALLPIQLVLLRFGDSHGLTDQLGVLLTILQWFGTGWALALPKEAQRDIPGKKRLLSRARYDRKPT